MRTHFFEKYPGFCEPAPPPGALLPYVYASSDAQLLKWLVRVRSWRIEFNVTNEITAETATGSFSVLDGSNELAGTGEFSNEIEKVCPRVTLALLSSTLTPPFFGVQFSTGLGGFVGEIGISEWLMKAYVRIDVGGGAVQNADQENFHRSAVAFTFDGEPQPMWEGAVGQILTGTITIDPDQYWPYARSDGSLPIWDEITGANLIPPTDPEFIVVA